MMTPRKSRMRCFGLLLMFGPASCLRQLELITADGKEAVEGGPRHLQCLACLAVVEDIQLAMDGPIQRVDEGLTNLAEYRANKKGRKLPEAEAARRNEVNTELFVQQVLNPRRCQESMKEVCSCPQCSANEQQIRTVPTEVGVTCACAVRSGACAGHQHVCSEAPKRQPAHPHGAERGSKV